MATAPAWSSAAPTPGHANSSRVTPPSRTCDVTDVFGHSARWRYDTRGCVVGFRDFDARQYAFQYSRSHWPGGAGTAG